LYTLEMETDRSLRVKVYKLWRTLLPFLYVVVLIHFLKDITQDILKISTPLDLLGDVKEDISIFPIFFQNLFISLGIGSFIAEFFLLVAIPVVIRRREASLLEKTIFIIFLCLGVYFLAATLLDPRFR